MASTVVGTGEAVVPLPALNGKVHYKGVPKRYEETKPVLVRDLTHRKILGTIALEECVGNFHDQINSAYIITKQSNYLKDNKKTSS